jgi:hypothetical protein
MMATPRAVTFSLKVRENHTRKENQRKDPEKTPPINSIIETRSEIILFTPIAENAAAYPKRVRGLVRASRRVETKTPVSPDLRLGVGLVLG